MFNFKWDGKSLNIFQSAKVFDLDHWLGNDRWSCFIAPTPEAIFRGFIDRHYGSMPVHMTVVNADPRATETSVMTVPGKELVVSGQSGIDWTDPVWMALQGSGATPLDGKLLSGVGDEFGFGGDVDPNVTKNTGSANRELHLVMNVIAEKFGTSNALLRRLDQYRHEQVMRPRQWWDPTSGFPYLGVPTRQNGVVVSPKLESYVFWYTAANGMNGYDLEHLDAKELYSGWMLTGDPAYLWELLNLYAHVRAHEPRVQRAPGQTYGPWRAWAYWVELLVLVIKAVEGLPTVAWEVFDREVRDDLEFALMRWDELAPWTYDQGSIAADIKAEGYIMPWQRATEAHALQLGGSLLGYADMTTKADIVLDQEDAHIPTGEWVHPYWRTATKHQAGALSGTGLWMLSPYIESEKWRESPYAKAAIAKVKASGYHKMTSYYHFTALSLLGSHTYSI